jgi:hypothetical protein
MIVSGYALHLYCNNEDNCEFGHEWESASAEYTGETYGQCAKLARAKGWRVSRDRTRCVCPDCARAGVKLSDFPVPKPIFEVFCKMETINVLYLLNK